MDDLNDFIFSSKIPFADKAIKVFRFQYQHNDVYKRFINSLNCNPSSINEIERIPFLPISFFKNHQIITTTFNPQVIFESSGTTGSINSKHFIKDTVVYETSFKLAFNQFYGNIEDYCILGLLPSYLERKASSLIYMVDKLIQWSGHPLSGFHLYDHNALADKLSSLENQKQKALLIGVTYALLHFAEEFPISLNHTIVMETGGMKGKKKEMIRSEVHSVLKEAFGVKQIHSEYGMTELLTQAYALEEGKFKTPPWMRVLLREEDDPFNLTSSVSRATGGVINIIDLANFYSCSFIATDDAGKLHPDGRFEILGRTDNSDIRGCSLLTL